MKKFITYCNYCGKEFDRTDEACGFSTVTKIGFGSVHDGSWLRLDLCCDCIDNLVDKCKISPVVDDPLEVLQTTTSATSVYPMTFESVNNDPNQIHMEV